MRNVKICVMISGGQIFKYAKEIFLWSAKIAVQIFRTVSFFAQTAARAPKTRSSVNTAAAVIGADCVVARVRPRQVEPLQSAQQPQPVYVNNNVTYGGVAKSKWAAFFLCLFLGLIGAHKFYEGKIGMGVLYIFTGGLFGIGAFVDLS